MAQKTIIIYTDDLTAQESQEVSTHTFSLNGVNYEIDLSPESYDKLADALGPFIRAGRKTGRATKISVRKSRGRTTQDGASAEEIRRWARSKGIEVNDRGRVPAAIRAQYETAH
ncbi:Lsr2 family protein [Streptomyces sp. NPDC058286]|uniref:histone-like nucleoid-structuring protein Lsr2 n=1 Tax=Streptomyces sp. NPDC058286 TaxID=3346422 RepID=UPI0036E7F17A